LLDFPEGGLLSKKIEDFDAQSQKWRNGWVAVATFEGGFSQVNTSFSGKGVARYTW